jgi:predicted glycosyltransferase
MSTAGATLRQGTSSILFFGRDAYGLGQLKRTLTLSQYLQARWPALRQLVVTGTPVPQQLLPLEGVDYLKLPSMERVGPSELASRVLPIPLNALREMYQDLLVGIVRRFQPDAVIVDSAEAEVVPMLRYLKRSSPRTSLMLGLRDIVAEAPVVRETWTRDGVYDLLNDVYDQILIYGQPDIFDAVTEYRLSPAAAAKTRYVGYVRRSVEEQSTEQIRQGLNLLTDRLVVVTAGGGRDGYQLLETVVRALRLAPDSPSFDTLLVGGPLMPADHRQVLREAIPVGSGARFLDAVNDLTRYIAAADLVISMGGHSTLCEILSFARPAIVVPRVLPRTEQLLRAEALSRRGLVRLIRPDVLTPALLLDEVRELLAYPPSAASAVSLDGLPAVASILAPMFDRASS